MKDLTRIVQRLGVEMRSRQATVSKAEFLVALHERYDDRITIEQQRYCVDEWSWLKARRAMKDVAAEAEGLTEERQMMLPLSMGHIKVPRALPIVIKGVPETVTAPFAKIPQGDAYTESLQGNVNACIGKLTDWLTFWSTFFSAKPLPAPLPVPPTRPVTDLDQWRRDHPRSAA